MNLHNFSSNCLNTSRCLISLRDNIAMLRNLPSFPTISTNIGNFCDNDFIRISTMTSNTPYIYSN